MGMGLGTDDHTLSQTHHPCVWVINLFTQSKIVNIVIILNIIDTPTTTQDNPYPSLRVWVCMGMGMDRGENTHGLPMSHTSPRHVHRLYHLVGRRAFLLSICFKASKRLTDCVGDVFGRYDIPYTTYHDQRLKWDRAPQELRDNVLARGDSWSYR